MTHTEWKFFTIADYEEEEQWLREQSRRGLMLEKFTPPFKYEFRETEPVDMIYRLDYKNEKPDEEYIQMAKDFGWEYVETRLGWHCYRKKASDAENANDAELFSDNASRVEMITHIVKTRLLPLICIFIAIILPNVFVNSYLGVMAVPFHVLYTLLFAIYVCLIIHCSIKLKMLREKYKK